MLLPPFEQSKVFAYITYEHSILILEHPDHPAAGIQVPAGSLERGETPREGVLREAYEETGLSDLRIAGFLGLVRFDRFPIDHEPGFHNRWFFHLVCGAEPLNRWQHFELTPSDGTAPVRFELSWVDLDHVRLDFGHEARIGRLRESMQVSGWAQNLAQSKLQV